MSKRPVFAKEGVATTRMEKTIEAERRAREFAKIRRKNRQSWIWFIHNAHVDCQLYRGNHAYPKIKKMTAMEMSRANKELVIKYIKKMDQGNECALWQWEIKDKDLYRKGLNDFVRRKDV